MDVDIDLTRNLKLQAQLGNGSFRLRKASRRKMIPEVVWGLAYQFEY